MELKPCPFCGCKDIIIRREDYNLFGANCNDCGAEGSYCDTKEEAVEAWNKRVPQSDLLKACQIALDALGCDRVRQDRLEAQKIIHATIKRNK